MCRDTVTDSVLCAVYALRCGAPQTSEGKNGEKEKICDCIAKVIIIKVNFSTNRNCLAVGAVVTLLSLHFPP